MNRPEYELTITINAKLFTRVIIDQHYKEKLTDLDDGKILELVKTLNEQNFPSESAQGEFEYFALEPVFLRAKPYRLILVTCTEDNFIGVVNAFRMSRRSRA